MHVLEVLEKKFNLRIGGWIKTSNGAEIRCCGEFQNYGVANDFPEFGERIDHVVTCISRRYDPEIDAYYWELGSYTRTFWAGILEEDANSGSGGTGDVPNYVGQHQWEQWETRYGKQRSRTF